MPNAETTTKTAAIRADHIPALLFPLYLRRYDSQVRVLEKMGLVAYDTGAEEWRHTKAGKDAVARIRRKYAMSWGAEIPGGGRWIVKGEPLHCGDPLEIMLADGTWLRVRFEVEFTKDESAHNTGGRRPVFYLAVAGAGSLVCRFDTDRILVRRPLEGPR